MTKSLWAGRRERAAYLLREAPHAEEILAFYVDLTRIQEGVATRLPGRAWLERTDPGTPFPLAPELLPGDELLPHFDDFLREVARVGTDVITAGSVALLEAEPAAREQALREPAGFHARAFLEPVMTTLAANAPPSSAAASDAPAPVDVSASEGSSCPVCASLPVLGLLQDLPEALGARCLQCSLCATRWRVDRLHCASCGERSADHLHVHVAESLPWVRVDECLTCRTYLKTVDLRRRGDAVPVVDELATVELDVWASERGLTKVQANVLEL